MIIYIHGTVKRVLIMSRYVLRALIEAWSVVNIDKASDIQAAASYFIDLKKV